MQDYFWAVVCKNHRFHHKGTIGYQHHILLGETDAYASLLFPCQRRSRYAATAAARSTPTNLKKFCEMRSKSPNTSCHTRYLRMLPGPERLIAAERQVSESPSATSFGFIYAVGNLGGFVGSLLMSYPTLPAPPNAALREVRARRRRKPARQGC